MVSGQRGVGSARWLRPGLFGLIALLACFSIGEAAQADDSAAERRRRIENMNDAEKEQLRRRAQWFAELDTAEQRWLRDLHERIQQDEDPERLRRIMHGYCTWLKQLSPRRQAELLELKPAERIRRIEQLREEEANRPTREDMEGLFRWMGQYASKHETHVRESLPEQMKQKMTELDTDKRRWWLTLAAWRQWQIGGSQKPPQATNEDLAALRKHLTQNARNRLESESPERQWQILSGWVRRSFRHRMSSMQGNGMQGKGRRFRGPSFPGNTPPELQKELDRFFEEELSPEEQDRLLNLSGDEMQKELWRRYMMRSRSGGSSVGRSHRPGPGRGPGPPGGDRSHLRPPERGPRGVPRGEAPEPKTPL